MKLMKMKLKFLHTAFSSLTQNHGTLFDLSRLKTELNVMYAMTDFEGKSPTDLLDFLQNKIWVRAWRSCVHFCFYRADILRPEAN